MSVEIEALQASLKAKQTEIATLQACLPLYYYINLTIDIKQQSFDDYIESSKELESELEGALQHVIV